MAPEVEIYSKDSVKLNILREVINGTARLAFQLDGGESDDYKTQLHKDNRRVQVYGKFNISEDPTGEVLVIRPVTIENTLKVIFQLPASFSGKTISVIRNDTKAVEQEYEISRNTSFLEFVPQGKDKYIMRLGAASKEEIIEAEYNKDYELFKEELEDIKLRMAADASIIERYKDRDILPIEAIFQEVKLKLEDAEAQIRVFIEAKQKKTMEIENEIKSNKKQ